MGIDAKKLEKPATGHHEGHEVRKEAGTEHGIHGKNVAVDYDICEGCGMCLQVCPVNVYKWHNVMSKEIKEPGQVKPQNKKGSEWKSDPVNEKECIFCLACESTCPVNAIKITQK